MMKLCIKICLKVLFFIETTTILTFLFRYRDVKPSKNDKKKEKCCIFTEAFFSKLAHIAKIGNMTKEQFKGIKIRQKNNGRFVEYEMPIISSNQSL